MRITEVISDTNVGGAGVLLTSIVNELKNDFDFEVILPKGSRLSSRIPNEVKTTELHIAKDKSFSLSDIPIFLRHFKSSKPDILHTHASLSARLAGKLSGVSTCLSTRHCSKPRDSIKKPSALKANLYNFCTDITVSTADYATENLIDEGISESRIITIKNGSPDLKRRAGQSCTSIQKKLSLPHNAKIIGSVARLEKVKGQDLILRAAPEILTHFPSAHFLFLGDGSMREEYEKLASNLGIENHVTFLGFVENPEEYQRIFTVNVNASRGTETSCLATSECLSLGIPTVASDFGGNPEMIKDFKNGFIFSSDNPHILSGIIIRLLKDKTLYDKLSAGARESYLESFSLDKMVDEYRRLYNSLKLRL